MKKLLFILLILLPTLFLSSTLFSATLKDTNITVLFSYEPPPDLKSYEIKCQPNDEQLTTISLNNLEEVNATK